MAEKKTTTKTRVARVVSTKKATLKVVEPDGKLAAKPKKCPKNCAKRFRKLPVEVEAMRFTRDSLPKLVEWSGGAVGIGPGGGWMVATLGGNVEVFLGDWVLRGVEGEFYPCKPSVFAKTYEAVEE
jgi:hypothetical protein